MHHSTKVAAQKENRWYRTGITRAFSPQRERSHCVRRTQKVQAGACCCSRAGPHWLGHGPQQAAGAAGACCPAKWDNQFTKPCTGIVRPTGKEVTRRELS